MSAPRLRLASLALLVLAGCSRSSKPTPPAEAALPSAGPFALALGLPYSCWLDKGDVRCAGRVGVAPLGDEARTTGPWVSRLPLGARQLAGGQFFACALLASGEVRCWGRTPSAPAVPPATQGEQPTPTRVEGLGRASSVAAGFSHACALLEGGAVSCWGDNSYGQLGDDASKGRAEPRVVEGLRGARRLWLGPWVSCAAVGSETLCWGKMDQVMPGGSTAQPRPVRVPALDGARSIAVGVEHGCAALADGRARCWGKNAVGQLGDGTREGRPSPVEVAGLSGVVDVAVGDAHSCALLEGGEVRCWGGDYRGQLGSGRHRHHASTPSKVVGLEGAMEIAAASSHSCARLRDGSVRCWGYDASGELGDLGVTPRRSPVVAGVPAMPPPAPPGDPACDGEPKLALDPGAWKASLERAKSEDELVSALAAMRLPPLLSADAPSPELECSHTLSIDAVDIQPVKLSASAEPELLVTVRAHRCEADWMSESRSTLVQILRPAGPGGYCALGADLSESMLMTMRACMDLPGHKEMTGPIEITPIHLVSAEYKSLQLIKQSGMCGGYPRASSYELSYWDASGPRLTRLFEHEIYSESHSAAPDPRWTEAKVALQGKFPKEIMVTDIVHCANDESGQPACEGSRTKQRLRYRDGEYSAAE